MRSLWPSALTRDDRRRRAVSMAVQDALALLLASWQAPRVDVLNFAVLTVFE